jgi:TonB family protein
MRRSRSTSSGGAAARPLGLIAACALVGCASPPPKPAAAPVVVQPIEVTTTYIAAYAPHFARGQFAIVEICVTEEGAIDATRVAQSSSDPAFDAAALQWARLARYRPQLENGHPVYGCDKVRVEINRNPRPRSEGGADSALG